MTFQAIGDAASKLVDRWSWYQAALADPSQIGKTLLIHENEPQQGYYRVRRKDGPWEPVALFYPEGSDTIAAYREGKEVRDVENLWVWACRNPISYDAYEKAMDGNGFDDEPTTAPGIGDNSKEADPFDMLNIEFLGEKEMAEEFMKKPVKTQADADKVAIWAKRLTAIKTKAEGLHKVEKQPHLDAGRVVDDKWRDLKTLPDELAKDLKLHAKPFLQAKIREEEERQRKAREEAARAQRAAAEAIRKAEEEERAAEAEKARRAAEVEALGADAPAISAKEQQEAEQAEADRIAAKETAERLTKQAQEAEREAEARKVNAGRTGARIGVRIEKIGYVTDYVKAATALVTMKHPDMLAEIDRLAKAAAKKSFPFDGMEIREEERVV